MTTQPVPPGDTERLHELYWQETDRQLEALPCYQAGSPDYRDECPNQDEWKVINRACMAAVAAALVPPGFTVVRTDDLRDAKEAIEAYRASLDSAVQLDGDSGAWWTLNDLDVSVIIDRMKAALGEQG